MLELNDADFSGTSFRGGKDCLVLFYAKWCPFCRRFMEEYEKYEGKTRVDVARVDLSDTSSSLWDTFQIDVIPTAVYFENGQIKQRLDGRLGRGLEPVEFKEFLKKLQLI